MKKVMVGIIGCGTIANSAHIPAYLKNEDVEIKYFCDIIPERAKAAVEKYGCGIAVEDYHKVLEDPEVEAISVCTPNRMHAIIAIDAMRAGKHVLCEKPAARTYPEALEMQKVQHETGMTLNIGVVNRFNDMVNLIREYIQDGRLLHKMLSGLRPDWDIVVLPGSIEGAVKWFQEHPHPDIIFLDIQLTDGISFTFIEQAQPESMIIFTTAYDEYAIRAFTVNSIDYLLKPINRERLAEAIEKFERLTARYGNTALSNPSNELLNLLKNISNPEKKYRTRFLISGDEKLYTLQVEDIAYFYSENKITFAVTKEGKEHIIDLSLDKLSEQLNPDIFFRTNRQTLVSVHAIQKIENYFLGKIIVQVKPPFKDKITVSREKIAAMKLWLNY